MTPVLKSPDDSSSLSSFISEPAPGAKSITKRSRRSAPKSRRGCRTCKIRRIKCDEARPSCTRCKETNRTCDFLETNPTSPPSSLIWDAGKVRINTQPSSAIASLSWLEVQNLDYFQNVCTESFSGFFEDEFWSRNVLRYIATQPSIRYAAIAVAAIHRTMAFPKLASSAQDLASNQIEAFSSYTKAIQVLSSSLVDKPSRELACIASILFAAFEVLRGNDSAFMIHLKAAFKIMNTFLPSEKSKTSLADQLLSSFSRLDIQASSFSDSWHAKALLKPTIPPVFSTILAARNSLDTIIALMLAYVDPQQNIPKTLPIVPLPYDISRRVREIESLLLTWRNSFYAFLACNTSNTQRDRIAVMQLHISHEIVTISIAEYYTVFECSFDYYIPQFFTIVESARSIIEYFKTNISHGGLRVAFDLGIIQPLHFLTIKCRNRKLRRQAIALVEQAGREGTWDGVGTGAVLRWIVAKEEENMTPYQNEPGAELSETDVPDERHRLHRIRVEFHRVERKATIKGMRRLDEGGWEEVIGQTDYRGPPKAVDKEGFKAVIAALE